MEKNIQINLFVKQMNESDALAHQGSYLASQADYNFQILDVAYYNTGRLYASLKTNIENNKCKSPGCTSEVEKLKFLNEAPQKSLDFLGNIAAQLSITEDSYYDVNQNYQFAVSNAIFTGKPGFSKNDGYTIILQLEEDGSQTIMFDGGLLKSPLIVNSSTLAALIDAGSGMVAETPDINKDMLRLVSEVGVLASKSVNSETQELLPGAKISEEFILTNSDGSPDYEIIDIGMGKGRNILKYDLDKIKKKINPFIDAEVAGLLSSEQEAIAAWNVFISKGTSVTEDDEMVQNANAASSSWSYKEDLPLDQNKKDLFMEKYKIYFMNNYLKQFTTNQIPTVQADAAVFDLEEGRNAKAEKFMADNKLG